MEAFFASIDYWHWWILAGVLLIIEIAAPSFFFLWLSIAAGITGLALLAVPDLGWEYQILLFSGLSIISLTVFKRYQRAHPVTTTSGAPSRLLNPSATIPASYGLMIPPGVSRALTCPPGQRSGSWAQMV
jgi:hypothetical protein